MLLFTLAESSMYGVFPVSCLPAFLALFLILSTIIVLPLLLFRCKKKTKHNFSSPRPPHNQCDLHLGTFFYYFSSPYFSYSSFLFAHWVFSSSFLVFRSCYLIRYAVWSTIVFFLHALPPTYYWSKVVKFWTACRALFLQTFVALFLAFSMTSD